MTPNKIHSGKQNKKKERTIKNMRACESGLPVNRVEIDSTSCIIDASSIITSSKNYSMIGTFSSPPPLH